MASNNGIEVPQPIDEVLVVYYVENAEPLSDQEFQGLAETLMQPADSRPFVDPEPFQIPQEVGKAFAASMLGVPKVESAPNASNDRYVEPDWGEMQQHTGELSDSVVERVDEALTDQQALEVGLFDALPPEQPAEPEHKGFFRRNLRRIGATAVAAVVLPLAAVGLFGKSGGTTEDNPPMERLGPLTEETTTTIVTVPEVPTTTQLPIPSVETPAPVAPPEATVSVEAPANDIAQTIRIEAGRAGWVWNIIQKELTGRYGETVDKDLAVTRATLQILDQLAIDNGFGDDTDRLSGFDEGDTLKVSQEALAMIYQFKQQRSAGQL